MTNNVAKYVAKKKKNKHERKTCKARKLIFWVKLCTRQSYGNSIERLWLMLCVDVTWNRHPFGPSQPFLSVTLPFQQSRCVFKSYLITPSQKKKKKDRFIWLYRLFNSFVERLLAHFTTLFNLLLESEQKKNAATNKSIKIFGNLISSTFYPFAKPNIYILHISQTVCLLILCNACIFE